MKKPLSTRDERRDSPEIARALDYCDHVSSQRNNYLKRVSRFLPNRAKYRLFCTTYAAMRVIDDAVDEEFLTRPENERVGRRDSMNGLIDKWLGQAEEAAGGAYRTISSSFEPFVFEALNVVLKGSQIGLGPWRELASSMKRDVAEEALDTWNDFLRYCEGACVAPAAIFLYILGCRIDDKDCSHLDWPEPPDSYARDMAIFCYLVHILRDLPEDVQKNRQILTIPLEFFTRTSLRAHDFVSAIRKGEWKATAPLLQIMVGRAEEYERRAESQLERLSLIMPKREYRIVWLLHKLYVRTFRRLCRKYEKTIGGFPPPDLETA